MVLTLLLLYVIPEFLLDALLHLALQLLHFLLVLQFQLLLEDGQLLFVLFVVLPGGLDTLLGVLLVLGLVDLVHGVFVGLLLGVRVEIVDIVLVVLLGDPWGGHRGVETLLCDPE